MPANRTTVVLIIVGLLILAAIWYLLFGKSETGTAIEAQTLPASQAETTFIQLTARLEPVTFDTSILSDPRFTSLIDLRTAIIPEPSGRRDPFAPF